MMQIALIQVPNTGQQHNRCQRHRFQVDFRLAVSSGRGAHRCQDTNTNHSQSHRGLGSEESLLHQRYRRLALEQKTRLPSHFFHSSEFT